MGGPLRRQDNVALGLEVGVQTRKQRGVSQFFTSRPSRLKPGRAVANDTPATCRPSDAPNDDPVSVR